MKKICTATSAALLACTLTYEGNFQLNLQGIRQTAMGETGVAAVDINKYSGLRFP
jgi:long-chain fatty acid transport protein